MACGIRSGFGSTSVRPTRLRLALGGAWRQLRTWIARRREDDLAELDNTLLRDLGVIRERDIGVSCDEARNAANLFWPP